jgi:hypothetical protein
MALTKFRTLPIGRSVGSLVLVAVLVDEGPA